MKRFAARRTDTSRNHRRAPGHCHDLDQSLQNRAARRGPACGCSLVAVRNADHADDLMQETLARHRRISSFSRDQHTGGGSPRPAQLLPRPDAQARPSRRPGTFERRSVAAEQEEHLLMDDLCDALGKLPAQQRNRHPGQRRGLSCDEASGLAVRARTIRAAPAGRPPAELLSVESTDDLGPGRGIKAVIGGGGALGQPRRRRLSAARAGARGPPQCWKWNSSTARSPLAGAPSRHCAGSGSRRAGAGPRRSRGSQRRSAGVRQHRSRPASSGGCRG